MSFPRFAVPPEGEFLRDALGNPLPDESLLVLTHIDRLERENAALREENAKWREMIRQAVYDNNDILYWMREARSVLFDAVEKDRAAYAARTKEDKP